MAEGVGHGPLVAMIDQNLGIIANIQGNVALALLSYRSALERYRRLGDEFTRLARPEQYGDGARGPGGVGSRGGVLRRGLRDRRTGPGTR